VPDMSLKILKAGMLDTIQDMGRFGYQQFGINPTGTMDRYAAGVANILVGNKQSEAVIEMHFPGPSILFEKTSLVALSGADFDANINGKSVPLDHPVIINQGRTLQFRSLKNKSHCYLAVRGGIKIPIWLNSYSTNIKAEAGGYSGKRLIKDDLLELYDETSYDLIDDDDLSILPWKASEDFRIGPAEELMIIPSNEWPWLDKGSQEKFLKNPFYISPNSDRMGYRLASEPLYTGIKTELISSAVNFGTIQLLPDGQLIILMADHQTTGGYPRLGNIISTHLPKLAQMKAGEEVRFKFTDHNTAESLLIKQHQHLLQLEIACKLKLENKYT
jgi:antagonist of KipI